MTTREVKCKNEIGTMEEDILRQLENTMLNLLHYIKGFRRVFLTHTGVEVSHRMSQ